MGMSEPVLDLPLTPSGLPRHAKVMEFVPPATFQTYAAVARSKGFLLVAASPLTRSSYHAGRDFAEMQARRRAAVPKSFGA